MAPALASIELEEDTEAVPQEGVVFGDRVVPQQHQTGQQLGTGDATRVHKFGQAHCCLCPQVRQLMMFDTKII